MNGPSRMPCQATEQPVVDEETYLNGTAEDAPEVVAMFREVVKTALAYTTHLSRLFVFRIQGADGEGCGREVLRRDAQPIFPEDWS